MKKPINQLLAEHRRVELAAICHFIDSASTEELHTIIEEIRCVHDDLMVFNPKTNSLDKVESTSSNGECIQLNLEA